MNLPNSIVFLSLEPSPQFPSDTALTWSAIAELAAELGEDVQVVSTGEMYSLLGQARRANGVPAHGATTSGLEDVVIVALAGGAAGAAAKELVVAVAQWIRGYRQRKKETNDCVVVVFGPDGTELTRVNVRREPGE
jgi:hypothetical protein